MDSVKAAIKRTNSVPAVIPGSTTKYLQLLDISVNRAFRAALPAEGEAWMTSGEKSLTKRGRARRASFPDVCQWVITVWACVKKPTTTSGFPQAGLLREENSTISGVSLSRRESDIESANESENEKVCEGVSPRLFNSNAAEEDFSSFRAQEEDV